MSRYPCAGCNGHRSALCGDCEAAAREAEEERGMTTETTDTLRPLLADGDIAGLPYVGEGRDPFQSDSPGEHDHRL